MSSTISLLISNLQELYDSLTSTTPRPSLHPIPGTKPLTITAAIIPPLIYYIALILLPPAPPPLISSPLVRIVRTVLALTAAILFIRLPLAYHVPQSIGLTYQLGLVGIYGFTRVLDAFFISAWYFNHIPKRVTYFHNTRAETPNAEILDPLRERLWTDGGVKDPYRHAETANNRPARLTRSKSRLSNDASSSPKATSTTIHLNSGNSLSARRQSTTETANYYLHKTLSGPLPIPVYETARTSPTYPSTLIDRASWALELELSMRGQGFTWTTADIRHTRKTWLPTLSNRIHSILIHVLPVQLMSFLIIRTIYTHYLAATLENTQFHPSTQSLGYQLSRQELFDTLPLPIQLLLTASLGAFLMSAFSLGHSLFAILLHPLKPSPLAFFPPLYTTRIWDLTSVRAFWSFGWHRLFARLFLVWGVWPGEWLERKITGKSNHQAADIGKVVGAFASSAFVHSFSVRGVLKGNWRDAAGEGRFFLTNGIAVVLEGAVIRIVRHIRRSAGRDTRIWYDPWIGRAWWMGVVVFSGREFARGWVKSGLVREMAFR